MATVERIAALLDEITGEMARIGYWDAAPPDLLGQFERGELTDYSEAPSFALWLQCVFVPRARQAIATGVFPATSNVGILAAEQYDGDEPVEEALDLVDMLLEFDSAVNRFSEGGQGPRGPAEG